MGNSIGLEMFLLPKIIDLVMTGLFLVLISLAVFGFWKWYNGQTFTSAFFKYGEAVKLRKSQAITSTTDTNTVFVEHVSITPVATLSNTMRTLVLPSSKRTDALAEGMYAKVSGLGAKATAIGHAVIDRVEVTVDKVHEFAERIDDAMGTDFIGEPNPPEFVVMREKLISIISEVATEEKAAGNPDGAKALNALHEDLRSRSHNRVSKLSDKVSITNGYLELINKDITLAVKVGDGNGAKALHKLIERLQSVEL
jgi:hypothetical protein